MIFTQGDYDAGCRQVVLSWPQRIIRPAADLDVRRTATG
jgi:hypothetical protein